MVVYRIISLIADRQWSNLCWRQTFSFCTRIEFKKKFQNEVSKVFCDFVGHSSVDGTTAVIRVFDTTFGLRAIVGFCEIFVANIDGLTSPFIKLFSSVCKKIFSSIDKFVSITIDSDFGTITGFVLTIPLNSFWTMFFGGVAGIRTSMTAAPLPHSSSAFASGIDAMGILLNVLYFQRDLGDARFVFLNGDVLDDCSIRRFVKDLGDALRSRIFIGCGSCAAAAAAVAAARSRFNFNCSTADGLAVAFFTAVVNSKRLKSFNDVFGTPKRSLHVVERVFSLDLLLLALIDGIDVLSPKLLIGLLLALRSRLVSPFNGVDVLNFAVPFAFDLP